MSDLLVGTFDHDVVLRQVLDGVSYCQWADIEDVLRQINTIDRRDASALRVVYALCGHATQLGMGGDAWWGKVCRAIAFIDSPQFSDDARLAVITSVAERMAVKELAQSPGGIDQMARAIQGAVNRAKALAQISRMLYGNSPESKDAELIIDALCDALECIPAQRECHRIMLHCHTEISKGSSILAGRLLQACKQRSLGVERSGSSYWAVTANLATLLSRVYAPLEAAGLVDDIERRRMERAIDSVEPLNVQLELMGDCGIEVEAL